VNGPINMTLIKLITIVTIFFISTMHINVSGQNSGEYDDYIGYYYNEEIIKYITETLTTKSVWDNIEKFDYLVIRKVVPSPPKFSELDASYLIQGWYYSTSPTDVGVISSIIPVENGVYKIERYDNDFNGELFSNIGSSGLILTTVEVDEGRRIKTNYLKHPERSIKGLIADILLSGTWQVDNDTVLFNDYGYGKWNDISFYYTVSPALYRDHETIEIDKYSKIKKYRGRSFAFIRSDSTLKFFDYELVPIDGGWEFDREVIFDVSKPVITFLLLEDADK